MKKQVKRGAALLLAVSLLCGTLGFSFGGSAAESAVSEWVIYRPGVAEVIRGNSTEVEKTPEHADAFVGVGKRLEISIPGMDLNVPEELALSDLALYIRVNLEEVATLNAGQIELANVSGDKDEISFGLGGLSFTKGWNNLILPLDEAGASGGTFDLHKPIKWFRLYTETPSEVAFHAYFTDIHIGMKPGNMEFSAADSYIELSKPLPRIPVTVEAGVKLPKNVGEWVLSPCDGSDGFANSGDTSTFKAATAPEQDGGFPYMRAEIPKGGSMVIRKKEIGVSIPSGYALKDLALSMKVYVSDVTVFLSQGGQIELTSDTSDKMEINWTPSKLGLKNGWNDLCLPLTSATGRSGSEGFDCHTINYFRWYSTGSGLSDAAVFGIADLKIVAIGGNTQQEETDLYTIFSGAAEGETVYALTVTSEGHSRLRFGGTAVTFAGTSLFTGRWTHIAVVHDEKAGAFTLYVDGKKAETVAVQTTLPVCDKYYIGTDAGEKAGKQFVGALSDIRVWSVARTEKEIADNQADPEGLTNRSFDTGAAGLMGRWLLSENLSNIFQSVRDDSPQKNHGVIKGSRREEWVDYRTEDYEFLYNEEGEKDYFTVVFIPDIQELTTGRFTDAWYAIADWIADNLETENIVHVMSAGDSTWNNSATEYVLARNGYDRFTSKVSWNNISGNHDYPWDKTSRDSSMYNKYFGEDYILSGAAADTYAGCMEDPAGVSGAENCYYKFGVNGIRYMILQLEFFPRQSVIDWAKKIISENPEYNIILTTHGYMYADGKYMTETPMNYVTDDGQSGGVAGSGQIVWNTLVAPYDNVKLVICGHNDAADIPRRFDKNKAGNPVPQMMLNGQYLDGSYFSNCPLGLLGILRFSTDGTKVSVNYYSPSLGYSFKASNQFTADLTVTPAADCTHEAEKYKITKPATCTEKGEREVYCKECGAYRRTEEIPAAHDLTHYEATAATAARAGWNEYWYCEVCETYFKDAGGREEAAFSEVFLPRLATPGDADGDGRITTTDARLTLQYAAGKIGESALDTFVVNVDGDARTSTTDARLILQKAAGKIKQFPGTPKERVLEGVPGALVTLEHEGCFAARLRATYTLKGESVEVFSDEITVGEKTHLLIPEGATKVLVAVQREAFADKWADFFTESFAKPADVRYLTSGTTYDPACAKGE